MKQYSVQQLAKIAGVSVRTLHIYDQKGLLKPAHRTESKYRYYGEAELLKLQQILFYKELDFSLQEIFDIINDPQFDLLSALESHKSALVSRQNRLSMLLNTIDKTIFHLKNKNEIMRHEDLYEGLPKEKAAAYRAEAIEKWGQDTVEKSEKALTNMSKADFNDLKIHFSQVGQQLFALQKVDPTSQEVQALVSQHYDCICQFWGKNPTAEAYIGLGQLYTTDERYTAQSGEPQPNYAAFLSKAMTHFATNL
ncbi:MAG: MerR family transcriptional regulator [Saprospiraceae bacterium]|nr:MerR family transcriptional regulator [Saprospiraceae bacterium]